MENLPKVVGGSLPPKSRPERLHNLFAMEAVSRKESEELDQGCNLPAPPDILLYNSGTYGNPKAS